MAASWRDSVADWSDRVASRRVALQLPENDKIERKANVHITSLLHDRHSYLLE